MLTPSTPQRVTVVAFDLGGVLVDVEFVRVANALAVSQTAADAAFFADGLHDALTVGALTGPEFIDAAAKSLSLPAARVAAAWASMVAPLPDAAALVRWASTKVRVVAWSNTDPVHAGALLPHLPLDGEASALSFEIGCAKPDAAFFTAAVHRLGVQPAQVLFVDDRPENVQAALFAGVRAVQVEGVAAARAALVAVLGAET